MGSESEAAHYAYPVAECTDHPTYIRFLTDFAVGRQKRNDRGRDSLVFWQDWLDGREYGRVGGIAVSAALQVFQNCLKIVQSAAGRLRIIANTYIRHRRISPKCSVGKDTNGQRVFVLLLMVLTRIHPPEPGFFLPAI